MVGYFFWVEELPSSNLGNLIFRLYLIIITENPNNLNKLSLNNINLLVMWLISMSLFYIVYK